MSNFLLIDSSKVVNRIFLRIVDAVHVMTYNLRGVRNNYTDVNAPLRKRNGESPYLSKINVEDGMNVW